MRKGIVIAVAVMGLTLPVFAQQPAGAPPRGPFRPDLMTEGGHEADDLALVLGLRATQRPALRTFLQNLRPPAPPEVHSPDVVRDTPAEGFEAELNRMAEQDARNSAEVRRRIDAGRAFYAQLDDRQKQVFEAMMRLRHGPGGRHGPARPGSGGPGRPGDRTPDGTPIAEALPHD